MAPRSAAPDRVALAALLVAAVALGAFLRLDQFGAQVLIDDEWHAVHHVLEQAPRAMFLDFGYADYSIPLGMLYWVVAHTVGLTETLMRLPMLACGLATLVLMPAYVARRLPARSVALFAALLAIAPLLVIYSRMARPYAITLLLGWAAHAAFQRWWHAGQRGVGSAIAYVGCAALATWLHPIVGPFVAAPLAWGAWQCRRALRRALPRLGLLALVTGLVTFALVGPPLLAHPAALAAKGGVDSPDLGTLVGVWYAWLGTPSTPIVVACLPLAAFGAPTLWRALPVARSGTLGIALTFAALLVTRPMYSYNPITVARYLLPVVPLLLLALAVGSARIAALTAAALARSRAGPARDMRAIHPATPAQRAAAALAAVVAGLPLAALAWRSPLLPLLRHPDTETLHFVHHFDFRPAHNRYLPYMARIPLSPFWASLAREPRGSLRIAEAPFHFESYDWDAPRQERVSGQVVLPGYVSGLCVAQRPGETPLDPAFRFANAVHLASAAELAARRIDYVVWQKPYPQVFAGKPVTIGADLAACEGVLRARFGAPAYEDAALVAFRLPPAR